MDPCHFQPAKSSTGLSGPFREIDFETPFKPVLLISHHTFDRSIRRLIVSKLPSIRFLRLVLGTPPFPNSWNVGESIEWSWKPCMNRLVLYKCKCYDYGRSSSAESESATCTRDPCHHDESSNVTRREIGISQCSNGSCEHTTLSYNSK